MLPAATDAQRGMLAAAATWAPILQLALRQGYTDAVQAFGELLPLLPQAQRAELLAHGAKVMRGAIMSGRTAVTDAYSALCSAAAPGLTAKQRADLRKEIKRCQAAPIFGVWRNYGYYDEWKKIHPESYKRFKAMKTALES